jgi:hypothetical protein
MTPLLDFEFAKVEEAYCQCFLEPIQKHQIKKQKRGSKETEIDWERLNNDGDSC